MNAAAACGPIPHMPLRWADFITPSTLQLAPLLEILLEPVAGAARLSELQLGLQEALVNAVRHGNGCDPGKCLRVRLIKTPRWLVWQIQDEGPGMPKKARLHALPEAVDALTGRGLFLIHHCFDDVRWSPRGNRLQLAVRRPERCPPLFSGRDWGSPDH
jgi:serine/threonine-protein kinase RsbW/non-specific serine/threonine protein kinase